MTERWRQKLLGNPSHANGRLKLPRAPRPRLGRLIKPGQSPTCFVLALYNLCRRHLGQLDSQDFISVRGPVAEHISA